MGTSTTRIFPSLLIILTLGLLCHGSSTATDPVKRQLPSAMVLGTVYCDTCFHQQFSKASHFISGGYLQRMHPPVAITVYAVRATI